MRLIQASMAAACLAIAAQAQTVPDPLAELKASYETAITKVEQEYADSKARCVKGYPAALEAKEMLFRRAGDLDGVMAIRNEKDRYEKEDMSVPKEPPPGTDDQVKVLQAAHHKALADAELRRTTSILDLTHLYIGKLEELTKDLTRAGKIDEALAARAEQERVRKDPVVTAAEFAMADIKAATLRAAEPSAADPPADRIGPSVDAPVKCPDCKGTGQCDRCRGTGSSPHGFKGIRTTAKCIRCMGSGKCKTCGGTGLPRAKGN